MVVTGNETLTNNSSGQGYDAISKGDSGYTSEKLQDAIDDGRVLNPNDVVLDGSDMNLPSKTTSITYTDPVTGAQITTNVYDSNGITEKSISDIDYNYAQGVQDGQYINTRIATVQSGGDLTVNVGTVDAASDPDWMNKAENQFADINFKESNIYEVEDGGSLTYASKTYIRNNPLVASSPDKATTVYSSVTVYTGDFTDFSGDTRTVNNLDDFQAYNDDLIQAIRNGDITPEQYDAELQKAYSKVANNIDIAPNAPISNDDEILIKSEKEKNIFIHGAGSTAQIEVAQDASLQAEDSTITVIKVEDGATLINNGEVGVSGAAGFSDAISADNANVVNNGVIDAGSARGLNKEDALLGSRRGIVATGSSVIENSAQGIINVAGVASQTFDMDGIQAHHNSQVNNAGVINVGTGQNFTADPSRYMTGVELYDSASIDHSGEIYIGRKAMGSTADETVDNATDAPARGIYAHDSTTVVTQQGSSITIGTLAQNTSAIYIDNTNVNADINGTINVNGEELSDGEPLLNVAVDARNGAGNNGTIALSDTSVINLNGINNIGINVVEGSKISSAGTINIGSSTQKESNTLSFGAYVDDAGSNLDFSGTANLQGDNNIALHARNGGQISVTDTAQINFSNGENQIGYFVYGNGSSIDVSTGSSAPAQNVATYLSTLYRIGGGATYIGDDSNPSSVVVSGDKASAFVIAGKSEDGTATKYTSGAIAVDVSGADATAVKVQGGAQGELSDTASITLSGENATAGIVDGDYYNLTGDVVDNLHSADSKLTTKAELNSSSVTGSSGVMGYIARNEGTLDHQGSIDFSQTADSTGILVDNATLINSGNIKANGKAVHIKSESSQVSLVNNTAKIEATDGEAAFYIDDGATLNLSGNGQTVARGSAHGVYLAEGAQGLIIDDSTISVFGSGSAIENAAKVEGIQLNNTTIRNDHGIGVHTGASLSKTNSGLILVQDGTGIKFENIDGTMTDQTLDLSNSQRLTIDISSPKENGGVGIETNSSQDIKVGTRITIGSEGATGLLVKGTTQKVYQSGFISSSEANSTLVDINNGYMNTFVNSGKMFAVSSEATALENTVGTGVDFTNTQSGYITGQVNLLSGDNSVTLESGSRGDDFTTADGNDNFNLTDISRDETQVFNHLIAGTGTDKLNLNNTQYNLSDSAKLSGFEQVNLRSSSEFTLDNLSLALGDTQDDGVGTGYQIDADSKLIIKAEQSTTDTNFNSHLAGTGTVLVDNTNGNHFNFTSNNKGDGFTGFVELQETLFNLEGNNTSALTDATLVLSNGSVSDVGGSSHSAGNQSIGGINFNGGRLSFGEINPGQLQSDAFVIAENMDLSGGGEVQIEAGAMDNTPTVNNSISLLEQDDINAGLQLAASENAVIGSAGNLTLLDKEGNAITDATITDITQSGEKVAEGTYDYRLTSGEDSDGLYVNYGLTKLNLIGTGNSALVLNANNQTGNAADMSAQITGAGDLSIATGAGTVTLSNSDNDYTGATSVTTGTLAMNNDNVLGNTSSLTLAENTGFDMQGHSQTIGELETHANSLINFNGGELTLNNGGNIAGELAGQGHLITQAGTLTIDGANTNLTGQVDINDGATAHLNHADGLGVTAITLDGQLILDNATGSLGSESNTVNFDNTLLASSGMLSLTNGSDILLSQDNSAFDGTIDIRQGSRLTVTEAQNLGQANVNLATESDNLLITSDTDWTLNNQVIGAGNVEKQGAGEITLTDNAQWSGTTTITSGGLALGSEAAPVMLASSQVDIKKDGYLSGFGGTQHSIDNQGMLFVGSVAGNQSAPSSFTVGGDLKNSGAIYIGNSNQASDSKALGNQLTVNGNYDGQNGSIYFNSVLGDDNSVTDHMHVKGNTSGSTVVFVTNAGGSGAQTLNGIELIHVDGQSDGEFTQGGRIVAGAYDYNLVRGEGDNANNWYLSSYLQDGGEVVNPTDPTDPAEPTEPNNPIEVLRPEVGSYIANIAAANTMFVTRLHDRLGETQYTDALTGEEKVTSMWLRVLGGHNEFSVSGGQLYSDTDNYIVQLGGDIAQWTNNGLDRWHVGIMGGYGNSYGTTTSSLSEYSSNSSVEGYSLGFYGTWYGNDANKTGPYVDTWLQYSWFDNTVSGEDISVETYKSKGLTASVEAGYTAKVAEVKNDEKGEKREFTIQPQVQVVSMNVGSGTHKEVNGTLVDSTGDGNIQTRLGVRAAMKVTTDQIGDKSLSYQPYVEANWIHNTDNFGATLDGAKFIQMGNKDVVELKLGMEGQVAENIQVWGNASKRFSSSHYQDDSAMIGIKYTFK